jgi:prolyl oligopeptidase
MVSFFYFRTPRLWLAAMFLGVLPGLRADDKVLTQPVAPVRPVTDTYFGTKVVDNYRWMEDLKSPEVQKWMNGQAAYTKDYLSKLPGRDALLKSIEEVDNASTRVAAVRLFGSRYFYEKLTPADQTPKLYVRDGLTGPERLLVDPQDVGEATAKLIGATRAAPSERSAPTRYSMSDYYASDDGKYVAVEIAAGGSEEGVVRIVDATTGKTLPDVIDRIWEAALTWDPSGSSFYYSRLQKLGPGMTKLDKVLDEAAYLHHVGDDADQDVPVFGRKFTPNIPMVPADAAYVGVQPGSPYGIGVIQHGVRNEVTVAVTPADALARGKPVWTKIVDVDDDVTDFTSSGHDIWLMSHKNASRFKILHMSLDHPDIAKADVVVPESQLVLTGLNSAKDGVYIQAAQGGIAHVLRIANGQSETKELPLPFAGSVEGFSCNILHDGALLRLAGWTEAPQWYVYDPAANTLANTNLEALNPTDFSGITSVEVTAPGADGTPIPLSIVYRKDLKLDGSNPCLLEAYGAYGYSINPTFDATRLPLLNKGIVIAYAHVRGGGENGEDWHYAGQKLTKENTIKDFIACAQYLIDKGFTAKGKLALRGTSAGGITVGGALTQRPDLFALAIVNVGVVNALRIEATATGAGNTPEFGSVKDPDGFKALYAMDAYHHVKKGTAYPTVLLITGANDPRVDSWELFKMTAALQAANASKNPILLRVDTDAGHGIGSTKSQHDMITADQAALLLEIAGKS